MLPMTDNTPAGDRSSATPVVQPLAFWLPASPRQLPQNRVPLPPDSFSKSGVIEREFLLRMPVVGTRRSAKKALAQPAQDGDFLVSPLFHSSPKRCASRCLRI